MGKLTDRIQQSWENDQAESTAAIDSVTNLFDRLERPGLQLPIAAIGLGGTAILWFLLILFQPARDFFFYLPAHGTRSGGWFLLFRGFVVFAFPFLGTNALGHLLMPSIEEEEFPKSGFMSNYQQNDKSEKRWRIIIAAGMAGVLNVLLMFFLLS